MPKRINAQFQRRRMLRFLDHENDYYVAALKDLRKELMRLEIENLYLSAENRITSLEDFNKFVEKVKKRIAEEEVLDDNDHLSGKSEEGTTPVRGKLSKRRSVKKTTGITKSKATPSSESKAGSTSSESKAGATSSESKAGATSSESKAGATSSESKARATSSESKAGATSSESKAGATSSESKAAKSSKSKSAASRKSKTGAVSSESKAVSPSASSRIATIKSRSAAIVDSVKTSIDDNRYLDSLILNPRYNSDCDILAEFDD